MVRKPEQLISVVNEKGEPIENETDRDAGRILFNWPDDRLVAELNQRIDRILRNPKGLPDGKRKRTKLTPVNVQKLKSALIDAAGHASVWAVNGPLPNRVQGRGRPPDNAVFLFIDDIIRACARVGLKPGLRYVAATESLPVLIFIELAPLLWPVGARNPRRLFQRWQRHQQTLIRTYET